MMDKRTLLAIALSIGIIVGYQFLMAKLYPKNPVEQTTTVAAKETDKKEPQSAVNKVPQPPVVPQPVVPPAAKPAQVVDGEEIKIETELYSAVLSSVGGTVKKWELKKFKDKDGIAVVLQGGKPVVPALSIGFDDKFAFANVNYKVSGRDLKLDESKKTGTIEFQYAAPTYSIKRTYTFYYDSYKFDLKDEVTGLQEYWIAVGSNFGINNTNEDQHFGPVLLKDSDRIELSANKLKETKNYRDGLKWIAQEDKYFFAALVPLNPVEEAKAWAVADPSSVDAKNKEAGIISFKSKSGVNSFLVYAGPKDAEILKPLNVGLEHIIDFGFFAIVAKPLFWLLKLCYKLLGNYGWAIVLMAIVTRLPFIPLLNKSQESMKKMQEIQPKVNEIKEKYKKDPQKMQKEMMEIYKTHKINPVGGCLPMLIQLPIFIALYKVLSVAIELRGAPFMFWITDLSMKDPYYVLPIVMGATWFLQQKMMPTPGDPRQAKIMMFMPIIFTFMFLSLASGLVLYWLMGNVMSVIQQYFVNKKMAAQETS